MKNLVIYENRCTDISKKHYIYYRDGKEYFIITRDSKHQYKTVLMPNLKAVIDFIANLIKEGNDIYIESGTDRDEYHAVIDNDKIMDIYNQVTPIKAIIYNIVPDIDVLITVCSKK